MSRGFVKEEDQEEKPIIPPRAALPEGETNYVTPNGYQALLEEREALLQERKATDPTNETERRRAIGLIDGKLNLLNERITTARIIQPAEQPKIEVRFGAKVQLAIDEQEQSFTLVGVDEANINQQKIAFVAPLARIITGKRLGEKFEAELGGKVKTIKILDITYDT